jgi:ribose transport system substrate-binding protein
MREEEGMAKRIGAVRIAWRAAALLAAALAGCEYPPDDDAAAVEAGRGFIPRSLTTPETYVMVSNIASHPYWIDARKGGEDAARELGVKWIYMGPDDLNTPAQVNAFEQIAATEIPWGILVAALQPDAIGPAVDRAIARGIPVVTVDTDAPRSKRLCYLGTDNFQGGRVMGRRMAEVAGGKAKVGLASVPGQYNLEERIRGIRDVFRETPGMELVAVVDDKGDDSAAAGALVAMLQAHPEIDMVGSINAVGAGVAAAIRQTGKVGKVRAVVFDVTEPILNAIGEGVIDSAIVQRTYMMAFLGVKLLHATSHRTPYLENWARNGLAPLPNAVDTGVMVITKEQVGAFR